jgi:hypothetical protein
MDKFTFCANLSASLTPLPKSKTSSDGAGYTGKAMPEKINCTNYLLTLLFFKKAKQRQRAYTSHLYASLSN